MKIQLIKNVMRSPKHKFKEGDVLEVTYAKENPFHKGHKVYNSKKHQCYIFEDECIELN